MKARLIPCLLVAAVGCMATQAWSQAVPVRPAPPVKDVEADFKRAVLTPGTPYLTTAAQAIPTVEPKGIEDVIGKNPIATLKAGRSMSTQLNDMATAAGWMLIWEAPDFSIEHPVNVSSDFFKAIDTVIESAIQAGTRLKATFYRGNNTLRITEF